MKSLEDQLALLARGTEQIEPKDGLRKKLETSAKTGKPLRVKYGIDPTGIDVHLGHTVPLRKLRLFQELGHQAVLIIGNYTAMVGDPSGRDATRAGLTEEQVTANAQDYLKQISRIIDISTTEVRFNGEWFSKFSFLDVMSLLGKSTIQRMLEREDFSKRYNSRPESIPIYMHECLYPLMQGYDSVAIHADIELGGSEQLFNLMLGRRLQESAGQVPQVCITLPILRGLDGHRRMGKSLGNYIGVAESADQQFGKTMSIPDELMPEWLELLTNCPKEEIAQLTDPAQTHPMVAKKQLARLVAGSYHPEDVVLQAQTNWETQFSGKQDPENIPEVVLERANYGETIGIMKLLVALGFCSSSTQAKQKVNEGAVNIGPDRTKISDFREQIPLTDGLLVRLGSKNIARIRVE
ncbi:MAG: tyrosine--tRNA ligase [Zavarzinella sp.]